MRLLNARWACVHSQTRVRSNEAFHATNPGTFCFGELKFGSARNTCVHHHYTSCAKPLLYNPPDTMQLHSCADVHCHCSRSHVAHVATSWPSMALARPRTVRCDTAESLRNGGRRTTLRRPW
eukprot:10410931-Alexandrium_andersonii.AAC.1